MILESPPNGLRGFYGIFLLDLLTSRVQSTRNAMIDNASLFRVFNEEWNITQLLSEFFRRKPFLIYFLDKEFEHHISLCQFKSTLSLR